MEESIRKALSTFLGFITWILIILKFTAAKDLSIWIVISPLLLWGVMINIENLLKIIRRKKNERK